MKIKYFEYTAHWTGDQTAVATIDQDTLILLATLECDGSDEAEDIMEDIDDCYAEKGIVDVRAGKMYAFPALLSGDYSKFAGKRRHWNKVWKALDTNGWWAGQWEEGSYALALPGKENEAIAAIEQIEARVQGVRFNWRPSAR